LVTSSIVADGTVFFLFLGFGTAHAAGGDRSPPAAPSVLPARAGRLSAVPRNSPSCPVRWSTGTALPPPRRSTPRVGTAFRRSFGTVRSSDFCRAIAFRPLVLQATARAEPGRSPWV